MYCRQMSADRSERLKIDDFERNYVPEQALLWYTKDMCLYRLLNKALRVGDIDALVAFRGFINDLYKQLKQLHSTQSQGNKSNVVYRGQSLPEREMTRFRFYQKDHGKAHYFSFNSFLSTTLDRDVAMIYASGPTSCAGTMDEESPVLFEIRIDPAIGYVQPYANIATQSWFQDEMEILFMLGSIFRFESLSVASEQNDRVTTIKLSLASEDDSKLKQLLRRMRRKLKKNRSSLILLADTLLMMGCYDVARKYYEQQLEKLSKVDTIKGGQCYTGISITTVEIRSTSNLMLVGLARIAMFKDDFELSIDYQALVQSMARSEKDKYKATKLLGDIYAKEGFFNSATPYYNESLEVVRKLYGDQSLELADLYRSLGLTYYHRKMYTEALDYSQQSLAIQKRLLPINHYEIGHTYAFIGDVYEASNKLRTAEDYYVKADQIYREALLSVHPTFIKNDQSLKRGS